MLQGTPEEVLWLTVLNSFKVDALKLKANQRSTTAFQSSIDNSWVKWICEALEINHRHFVELLLKIARGEIEIPEHSGVRLGDQEPLPETDYVDSIY